jgi:NAD(P)-dependent dehydrogenase (short-subunit alcohol dehydrogenase family)
MKNLLGKHILVCGGATGIGAATVRRLCEEGARVGVGDFNMAAAEGLVEELNAAGFDAIAWYFDQSDEATITTLVDSAVEHFGRLDGLIVVPISSYSDLFSSLGSSSFCRAW